MTKSVADFSNEILCDGYSIFSEVIGPELLNSLRKDIPKRIEFCREWQVRNGMTPGMTGAAHHIVGGDDSLREFLECMFLDEYIRDYFRSEYILNSYGAVDNRGDGDDNYRHGRQFHRDVRTYSASFRLMINMLVMVDDFTIESGATKVVRGSHRLAERPSDDFLELHSVRTLGRAGSIVLFDSNLWHSAAPNVTKNSRMALTLTFTRPFFKQQMDYPRLLGDAFPRSEGMRQLLGYNSRVPSSYDEWFQPPDRRMYKPGQG